MKKTFNIVILLLFMTGILIGAGCEAKQTPSTAPPVAKIPKPKPIALPVLKVGVEAVYAPFEFIDENTNEITGFDVEFIKAVAGEAGMKVELQNINRDSLYTSLNSEKVDVIISAMTITSEEKRRILFSDPYFVVNQLIVTKEGAPYRNLESLTGQIVGVQGNSTSQYILEESLGYNKNDIMPYPTTADALTDLVNGNIAAVVADEPSVLYFIKTNVGTKIAFSSSNFVKEYYGVAVEKNNIKLIATINSAIKKVKAIGKYDQIYKKYFGDSVIKSKQ